MSGCVGGQLAAWRSSGTTDAAGKVDANSSCVASCGTGQHTRPTHAATPAASPHPALLLPCPHRRVEAGRVHLELGQVPEGVAQLEAALQCEVEDINAWHTRMDAEKMLAQVGWAAWTAARRAGCVMWLGLKRQALHSRDRGDACAGGALGGDLLLLGAPCMQPTAELPPCLLPLPLLLPQVRRQPFKQPSLIPPHALQQEAAAAAGTAAAPAASISTAALLRCARVHMRAPGRC